MLVLSRRRNESVIIQVGEIKIRVIIADIGRHQIRLGIEAPRQVPIFRAELIDYPLQEKAHDPRRS